MNAKLDGRWTQQGKKVGQNSNNGKLTVNGSDRRSAVACPLHHFMFDLYQIKWAAGFISDISVLSFCQTKEEKRGSRSETGIRGHQSHRLMRLIASCSQTAWFGESLHMPESWQPREEQHKLTAGTCNGAQYVICVCLYEGLHEFKCLQMFARLFLAILGRSLVFYDPTFWQLKLQCCQAVNCSSNKLAWPTAGSALHFSWVQHQQNTAVLWRPRSEEKGQETSCCVFQLISLVSFQLCVSDYPSVGLCTSVWWSVMQVHACVGLSPSLVTLG